MLSVIKTAIITIIISFISGVLLDNYKNFAPRILCVMGKGIPIRINNRNIKAYDLIVKNISSKTIHDLNLNVQGHYDRIKIDQAKITNGLRFDLSNENNIYNVSIPFLSKDDKFSAKLFIENKVDAKSSKPIVTLRSPENFKKIYSKKQNGIITSLLKIPDGINDIFSKSMSGKRGIKQSNKDNYKDHSMKKSFFMSKKMIITTMSILFLILAGTMGLEYYNKMADKYKNSTAEKHVAESTVNADADDSAESTKSTSSGTTEAKKNTESSKNTTASVSNTKKKAVTNTTDSSGQKESKPSNTDKTKSQENNIKNTDKSKGSDADNNSNTAVNSENSKNNSTSSNAGKDNASRGNSFKQSPNNQTPDNSNSANQSTNNK